MTESSSFVTGKKYGTYTYMIYNCYLAIFLMSYMFICYGILVLK